MVLISNFIYKSHQPSFCIVEVLLQSCLKALHMLQ